MKRAMNLPPYIVFPRLHSNELLLRKVEPGDIPKLVAIYYYDGKRAANTFEAMQMQDKIEQDYKNGESIHWLIENRDSGEILGTCGYYRDFKHKTGELGCILLPEASGSGYMTRAMQLAIKFGFRNMQLKKIISVTSADNLSARNLLERLNFNLLSEKEGMLHYELLPAGT